MSEKGLIFMTANPFHHGHLALVENTLKHEWVSECDIYVWNRAREWTLPHDARISAIESAMTRRWLGQSVHVITNKNERVGSILEIRPKDYVVLAMGSDIANSLCPSAKKLRDYEIAHFLSFAEMIVMERPEHPLMESAEAFIRSKVRTLRVLPPVNDLSGTKIRGIWNAKEDIRPYLPDGVYERIAPYLEVFQNARRGDDQ